MMTIIKSTQVLRRKEGNRWNKWTKIENQNDQESIELYQQNSATWNSIAHAQSNLKGTEKLTNAKMKKIEAV